MIFPVLTTRICTLLIATGLLANTALAQSTENAPEISLELNNAADTGDGGCRLTYVATNRSGQALNQISYQVGIFDAEGIVRRILVLEFGALTDGKTKIVLFDLAEQTCADISRIIVNDVAQCTLATNSSAADFCLNSLSTNSRTNIQFGT